jgi:hypothetical protein
MAPVKGPSDLHVFFHHVVMMAGRMAHHHVLVVMHPGFLVHAFLLHAGLGVFSAGDRRQRE